ncbi:MAG TPA: J domain-containing protein [Candidatus Dormibacteraeota bacterium]|nr:J domain-containing protein [Candidatus Dormibacteraeota bacterium]
MSRLPTGEDFAVLGLRPGAGANEVRAAYRRLAKIHHPDRNPGDTTALETFQRITDAYAALRDHSRLASGTAAASPLTAARAARQRASSAAGSETSATPLADIPVGGAVWVDEGAVLVAPDRTAALRPAATGVAFPTAEQVIRVERRADGLHVFLPPRPSARWKVGSEAETEGMAVAALWVGEHPDGPLGSPSAARVPLRLLGGTVGEMELGARGWTAAGALSIDGDGLWTIDLAQPVSAEPHPQTRLRVLRDADGFRVHADLPASEWSPTVDPGEDGRAPVVDAILAGTRYSR